MKRTLIAAILGITLVAANSYGSGSIIFSTYLSSSAMLMAVTYNGNPVTGGGYSAELFYGLGSGLSFNQLTGIPSSQTVIGAELPGLIIGNVVTLQDWNSGPVTFGIQIVGQGYILLNSATWTEPASNIAPIPLPPNFFTASILQATFPSTPNPFLPVSLIFVPEPGILAMTGLGAVAFASLKRRQV